jgi:hypothetical protein
VNGAEDAEEDFLLQVEGLVAIAKQVHRKLINHPFMTRHELGTGRRFARGAALDQRRFAVSDLNPTECPGVFHDGICHGQSKGLETSLL